METNPCVPVFSSLTLKLTFGFGSFILTLWTVYVVTEGPYFEKNGETIIESVAYSRVVIPCPARGRS